MFKFFKRERKFSLTFAFQGGFKLCDNAGVFQKYSDYHIGYEITMRGPVSRDAILQTVKEYEQKCTDETEKKMLQHLLKNAELIAWNEID